jgi:hypothetical protein
MDLVERGQSTAARHPWEVVRARFFIRLLEQLAPTGSPVHLLDVGSGDAWLADQLVAHLAPGSGITCWDTNYTAEDLAETTSHPEGITLTSSQPTTPSEGVLMLDVMEHVEDDLAFVSGIVETSLAADGWLLLSVPAYQSLFNSHDTALKHFRRYSPRQCAEVLRRAGLRVEVQGGLFHSLLAARGALVAKERVTAPPDGAQGVGAWEHGPGLTRTVTTILSAESRLSLALGVKTRAVLPGLSYWAFCRRASVA